jgi:hypothetical protein
VGTAACGAAGEGTRESWTGSDAFSTAEGFVQRASHPHRRFAPAVHQCGRAGGSHDCRPSMHTCSSVALLYLAAFSAHDTTPNAKHVCGCSSTVTAHWQHSEWQRQRIGWVRSERSLRCHGYRKGIGFAQCVYVQCMTDGRRPGLVYNTMTPDVIGLSKSRTRLALANTFTAVRPHTPHRQRHVRGSRSVEIRRRT